MHEERAGEFFIYLITFLDLQVLGFRNFGARVSFFQLKIGFFSSSCLLGKVFNFICSLSFACCNF